MDDVFRPAAEDEPVIQRQARSVESIQLEPESTRAPSPPRFLESDATWGPRMQMTPAVPSSGVGATMPTTSDGGKIIYKMKRLYCMKGERELFEKEGRVKCPRFWKEVRTLKGWNPS